MSEPSESQIKTKKEVIYSFTQEFLIHLGISGTYPDVINQSIVNEHLMRVWQLEFWITTSVIIDEAILVIIYHPKIDRIREYKEVN